MKLFYKLLDIPVIGNKLKMIITDCTGGMAESKFIRKFCKDRYNVEVDLYTYGSCFSREFNLGGKVKVGKYCSIAPNVKYLAGNHPINYISTSPYFYNPKFSINVKDIKRGTLEIGNDCWIGYGAIITSKCNKIGNGAVIAAGAIVTKDVPAYAVVAGSPARVIKYRFDEETIKCVEESAWWEYSPKELLKFYGIIDKPIEFCRRLRNGKK